MKLRLLVLAFVFCSVTAFCAIPGYVSIVGVEQGPILGDADVAGREGTIEAIGYSFQMNALRDTACFPLETRSIFR
ncbi:MAG: hypothetical protein LLF76_09970 [Planctomycetaceae bacterium]|nr:hypothetical protein [Planctomycetaceae bacterium]